MGKGLVVVGKIDGIFGGPACVGYVTPLVLIFANYVLSMFKIDHEPLHTHIRAFECIWTIETAKIWLSVEIQ